VAEQVLKQYRPYEGHWPRDCLHERIAEARSRYAAYLEGDVGNL